ncbi:phosphatase PAP2 family protein [Actinacidiphila yeochonensis]|uniref:phosphatase PAP2 family protein n=1 Tax=Actinacidiphila yeochonensis TaxID=89050 RepID=UPI00099B9E7F|nr:phosphatase PAP2 family protein [Actinacidiphila yeochonensis]
MSTAAADHLSGGAPGSASGPSGPSGAAGSGTSAGRRSRLRRWPRRPGRPHLLVELTFSVALYFAYSRTRRWVPRHETAALHRAREVWHAERWLHLDPELAINHAVNHVDWLIVGMNYYYATLHFVVTLGTLIWVYARHPSSYRGARTALYTATLLALIGFAFCALAPPRFLTDQGFIDTVVTHHTWGSWDSGHVSSVSNEYAAMPSVHIVWSGWAGLTIAALARRTWVRVLGLCYPLVTFTVILSTANHFVTDAVAGALTLALGFLAQRLLTGLPAYHLPGPVRPSVAAAGGPSPARRGGSASAVTVASPRPGTAAEQAAARRDKGSGGGSAGTRTHSRG